MQIISDKILNKLVFLDIFRVIIIIINKNHLK